MDRVEYERFGFTEKSDIYEGHENPIYSGELPEKGEGLGQFADLRGGLWKREGWYFWCSVDTPMYITCIQFVIFKPCEKSRKTG